MRAAPRICPPQLQMFHTRGLLRLFSLKPAVLAEFIDCAAANYRRVGRGLGRYRVEGLGGALSLPARPPNPVCAIEAVPSRRYSAACADSPTFVVTSTCPDPSWVGAAASLAGVKRRPSAGAGGENACSGHKSVKPEWAKRRRMQARVQCPPPSGRPRCRAVPFHCFRHVFTVTLMSWRFVEASSVLRGMLGGVDVLVRPSALYGRIRPGPLPPCVPNI